MPNNLCRLPPLLLVMGLLLLPNSASPAQSVSVSSRSQTRLSASKHRREALKKSEPKGSNTVSNSAANHKTEGLGKNLSAIQGIAPNAETAGDVREQSPVPRAWNASFSKTPSRPSDDPRDQPSGRSSAGRPGEDSPRDVTASPEERNESAETSNAAPTMQEKESLIEPPGLEDDSDSKDDEDNEPWRLFQFPCLESRDIQVQGWWAQGFTWNPDCPADRTNGLMGMNDRANDYLFDQLGLTVEHPLEDEPVDWDVGWRVGMMYGADARFVQALGFDDDWNSGRFVALAMPELFADIFVPWGNGAVLRVGRFWSPIGYEGVPARDRFFYSATNTFMLAEPSTHTGLGIKVPLNEQWVVQAGLVQGWDVWSDNNDSMGALATLAWISPDERTTITYVLYSGDESDDLDDNQFTYSLMITRELTDRFRYVWWHDFGHADDVAQNSAGDSQSGQWFSLINGLFYAIHEDWSLASRIEWFRDDDGVKITHPVTESSLGPDDLFGLTLGANYAPTANLLIRPEIRWDWSSRIPLFDDQTDTSQFTASCDVVWSF